MESAIASPLVSGNAKTSLQFDGWTLNNLLPRMDDEMFFVFCKEHPNLKIEQDKNGNLHIMAPVSYDAGNHEAEIIIDLGSWNRKFKLGKVFSSQTMFLLPDGEKRMPDAAWISKEKDALLSTMERRTFAHVVPDFIVEIASPSDNLTTLLQKMSEIWMANGVKLSWLIDPQNKQAYIFRADGSQDVISHFNETMSGEDVLPGFVFDLSIFNT